MLFVLFNESKDTTKIKIVQALLVTGYEKKGVRFTTDSQQCFVLLYIID